MKYKENSRSFGGMILDLFMICCTGGFWVIWIVLRSLRKGTY